MRNDPLRRVPFSYLFFAAPVLLVAALTSRFAGGAWFERLVDAPWSPPLWVALVGWPLALLAQSLAGWLAWRDGRGAAWRGLGWWLLQWPLHVAWSWLFYVEHRPGWSLGALGLMLGAGYMAWREFRSLGSAATPWLAAALAWLSAVAVWQFAAWRISGGGWSTIWS